MPADPLDDEEFFTKENIDDFLNKLALEYRKSGGRGNPIELIIVGGAVIVDIYGFRDSTRDIDAYFPNAEAVKHAAKIVSEKYDAPDSWLNNCFMKTGSFTTNLRLYSVPYKTFRGVIRVRMVTDEYLIAMKLISGRDHTQDLSDVIGILQKCKESENPITIEMVENAAENLYGSRNAIPVQSMDFLKQIFNSKDYVKEYEKRIAFEKESMNRLLSQQNTDTNNNKQYDRISIVKQLEEYQIKSYEKEDKEIISR